jgi:hypothetical protein
MATSNLAAPQSASQSRCEDTRSDKKILEALQIASNVAFRYLHDEKWAKASKVAEEALRLAPRRLRRTSTCAELEIVAFSGRAMGTWFYWKTYERRRRRQGHKHRKVHAAPLLTPATPLLLIPETPARGNSQ